MLLRSFKLPIPSFVELPPAQIGYNVAFVKRFAEISWVAVVVSAPTAVPVNDAEAETRPVLVVVTVISLDTPAANPVTVIRPVEEINAEPPLEAEIVHVYEESKLET